MREIKARALLNSGKWIYVALLAGHRKFEGSNDDYVDGAELITPWLQSSGLKDKNGKEIYDGDIVKIHWPTGSHAISKVGWDFSSWQLEGGGMICNFKNNELEIIGNIFENTELLTPEDSNEAK